MNGETFGGTPAARVLAKEIEEIADARERTKIRRKCSRIYSEYCHTINVILAHVSPVDPKVAGSLINNLPPVRISLPAPFDTLLENVMTVAKRQALREIQEEKFMQRQIKGWEKNERF